MKKLSRNLNMILAIAVLLILGQIALAPCPDFTNYDYEKPFYLDKAWPPPGSSVPFGCYTRRTMVDVFSPKNIYFGREDELPRAGVAVTIHPNSLRSEMIDEEPHFLKRVFIYVNGKERRVGAMEKQGAATIEANYPKWFYFGSHPFLVPGEHVARFVVQRNRGVALEFEWHFRITWW